MVTMFWAYLGLLQTMALMDRKNPVDIYGPVGIAHFLDCLRETLQFGLTFIVNVHEISEAGVICEEEDYLVEAERSNHAIVSFCFAFVEKARPGKFHPEKARELGVPQGEAWGKLQRGSEYIFPDGRVVKASEVAGPPRKGRKIVYTGDTRPFDKFASFAKDADIVIHEATFDDTLVEKAEIDGHSTPSQAATEAKLANAQSLVLTHISARYTETTLLLESSNKNFP